MTTATTDRKKNKSEPGKVKVGDLMAFTYYVKVTQVNANGNSLMVNDLDGSTGTGDIRIDGKELVESSLSADQFAEEVKVSKTEAAELLVSSHNRPLSVSFMKTDGSERTMRGRLVKPEPLLGRSMVEDLDIVDPKNRIRQVDHRTINWLVVDGVKYVVK